ncbi:hypothetical protein PVBG_04778 [Plasmodium vivax Brazil I]|uniref:Variable surface protein n=1 Tax=Plasmodium vivax (strain Brazil I) TaxID=1033975 RepID=A0A0J9T0B9_PLAV1|nr:hypothetical protein PVBG_04778 [Plasmodium vivax Brazil I]
MTIEIISIKNIIICKYGITLIDCKNLIDLNISYTFLDIVWNRYNEFDKPVEGDKHEHWYHTFCDPFMTKLRDNNEQHKNFCLKLIRNLGHYSENLKFLKFKHEDCTNLNNWVYNSKKKYDIPDNIITECFDDYKTFMDKTYNISRCSYYSYDDIYEEPINIIILNIFVNNIDIIQDTLNGEYISTNFPLRKYICECIKIYKAMNPIYCPKSDAKSEKSNKTCEMLNTFKNTYESYLSATSNKNYKIKSLDNDEVEYLAMCTQDKPRSELTPEGHRTLSELASLNRVRAADTEEISSYEGAKTNAADRLTPSTEANVQNQGNSMSRTVSTAVGTVAGASSILALLYKVNKNFYLNI